MPITGICHDFAFSRCYPHGQWESTPAALPDDQLWTKVQKSMTRIEPGAIGKGPGVLTVANPSRAGGSAAYCTHSYFIDASGFLLSTNDPFYTAVAEGGGTVVPVHSGVAGVVSMSYTVADLIKVMSISASTAKIGRDQRALSFYKCPTQLAVSGFWHA